MKAFSYLSAASIAAAALAGAAPAEAQFFPGYGSGVPYARPSSQVAINQCSSAVQGRLGGGYAYGGYAYGGPRVLGVSQVNARADGGITVHGVASSGRFASYGYGADRPDLTWRCRTDFRGFVTEVSVFPAQPAQPAYGYGNAYGYGSQYGYGSSYGYGSGYGSPQWNDYSQYGYVRY